MRTVMSDYERLGFRHAPDATLVLAERVVLRASLMVEEIFGWPPHALEGQSVRVLYPGAADFELIGERAAEALATRPVYSDRRFMRRRDGQIIWVSGRGHTLDQSAPHRLSVWTYRLLESTAVPAAQLTASEMRVARYLVNGFTSKQIGQALACSHRTVEVHRANMIRKLGVRNSSELIGTLFNAVSE